MTSKARIEKEKAATDQRDLTPNEAMAEALMELRGIHQRLSAIQSWVAFLGIALLIAIVLAACNAIMGL